MVWNNARNFKKHSYVSCHVIKIYYFTVYLIAVTRVIQQRNMQGNLVSKWGNTVKHINPSHLSKIQTCHTHTVWPGKSSVYGSENLPCFAAYALLVDLILPPAHVRSAGTWVWSQLVCSWPWVCTQASRPKVGYEHLSQTFIQHHSIVPCWAAFCGQRLFIHFPANQSQVKAEEPAKWASGLMYF